MIKGKCYRMKMVILVALSLLVIGVIGVGVMTVFGGGFHKVEIHKKEMVAGGKIDEIEVKTSAADVEVVTVDSKEIEVLLDGNMSKGLVDKYKFMVKEENNRLNVEFTKDGNSVGWNVGTTAEVKLQIKVPSKLYENMKIKTSSGDVLAKEMEIKTAEIKTSSGDISLLQSKINEKLTAKTSSGAIETNKSEIVAANLTTSSGEIKADGLHSDEVVFTTSSGNIEYNDKSLQGEIECNTSSGDVHMKFDTFPESLKINFEGGSGKPHLNVPGLLYEEKTKHKLIGVKGSGEHKLQVKTSSGDFKLQ